MSKLQIIALTPPGLLDPAIAIAASRAGGIGILDLELIERERDAESAFKNLRQYARGCYGVRLNLEQEALISTIISRSSEQPGEYVILTGSGNGRLADCVDAFHDRGLLVLLESLSVDQARRGMQAGADGVIAKGNEAGGWVGHDTAFIFLQRLLKEESVPVWVHGGIGPNTAAGCCAAGAAGVVVDSQLWLARESRIPESAKMTLAGLNGSESLCLGGEFVPACRVFGRPGSSTLKALQTTQSDIRRNKSSREDRAIAWRRAVASQIGWDSGSDGLWFVGQDVGWAKRLADQFHTVGGILEGIRRTVDDNLTVVRQEPPFSEASPLAQSHGTRYPIVQGPMARVSDRSAFALEVARAGALPFLAVGYMGAASLEKLLHDTSETLGTHPWGVGILGFLPSKHRQEQLEIIRRFSPSFAILAGGRPDQVLPMEEDGIKTYVHVPSTGLLDMFLKAGARRFIFEGRECGGHVGPRSSFVLWESVIDVFLKTVSEKILGECHILFAGGIHDSVSSAVVGGIGAPLLEKGVRLGLLMGTAYLLTNEAVSTGAIVEGFQKEALDCEQTALLESSPGHAVRCTISPYVDRYHNEKERLVHANRSPEEVRRILEGMNRGRLRIASKGVKRNTDDALSEKGSSLMAVDKDHQRNEGLYMIGQLATLWNETRTIEGLHKDVCLEGSRRLTETQTSPLALSLADRGEARPSDVAIIGMACLMPKAQQLQHYWENIINKVNAVTEVPKDRWDWRRYFEADTRRQDRFYSKWGGFLDPVPFDPMRYGMPPNSLKSVEPLQLLTLETVRIALADAGYADRPFPRERTSVIVGASGGLGDLGQSYAFRAALPTFFDTVPEEILSQLPEWTEDSFAGTLTNVTAGRVANRLNLGGVNYSINAACASSLAAVYSGVRELEAGSSDMVLVAGADTFQNPHFFFCFSKTHALSPTGRCRTFDKDADGTCISEGIAVVALKRLADAERDGDRVYGVIKAVGGSSDGRHKGLTAPHPEGQARALNRAYAKSGISPASVGLIEAHGTGTVAGDRSEIETLKQVFSSAHAEKKGCALGSVKSTTGHTKSAAGIAGLIKVALALHHKVLPPTVGVENPNPSLADSPFYVNTELRPWIHSVDSGPRRAGVSSFGFGGTNFHTVVEEYTDDFLDRSRDAVCLHWPSELFLFSAESRRSLLDLLGKIKGGLLQGAEPELVDLAYALWKKATEEAEFRLAIVAHSLDDLQQKIDRAEKGLREGGVINDDALGVYYSETGLAKAGKTAFLFPGQGSQHPGMLRELAVHFPEVRECFSRADRTLDGRFATPLTGYIFPPPCFTKDEERRCHQELTQTHVAQPALSAAAMGVFRLLRSFRLVPELVAGHSSGEYAALCVAGVFDEKDLYRLTEARGRFINEMTGDDTGTMAAVKAGRGEIEDVLAGMEGVWIANLNAPKQTIISGGNKEMAEAEKRLEQQGMRVRTIPVSCAFHSPIVEPARDRLAEFIQTVRFNKPCFTVFSNTTSRVYPEDPQEIRLLLSKHLVSPVNFSDEIEQMYEAGARVFIEVGPRNVLTGLVRQILGDRPHLVVPADKRDRSGLLQLNHLLGQLAGHGANVDLERLYQGRVGKRLNLDSLVEDTGEAGLSRTTWMITGGKVWRQGDNRPACPRPVELHHKEPGTLEKSKETGKLQSMTTYRDDSGTEMEQVMLRHEKLMAQFLETHKEVMKACLGRITDSAELESSPDLNERFQEVSSSVFQGPHKENRQEKEIPEERISDTTRKADSLVSEATDHDDGIRPTRGIDEGELTRYLVRIVSERTGYPEDMIGLDLSLDADLGIDSIKWVEILGTLQQSYLKLDETYAQSAMEQLSEIGTLRGVIDWFSASASNGADTEPSKEDGEAVPKIADRAIGGMTDTEVLTRSLVGIVSERTGYPEDMIDLDVSLDADLGIDSIKWVEILGTLQQAHLQLDEAQAQSAMEALSEVGTLRDVIRWFEGAQGADGVGDASDGVVEAPPIQDGSSRRHEAVSPPHEEKTLPRYVLSVADKPLPERESVLEPGTVFVITDDERGVAQELAELLEYQRAHVVLLRNGKKVKKKRKRIYTADLESVEQVNSVVSLIGKKEGPISGIVHLLPLRVGKCFEDLDSTQWRTRLSEEVKGLFLLAKGFGNQLKQGGTTKGAWVIAATAMGGAFGIDGNMPRTVFPGHGGVSGVVKTLAVEWPDVNCKVVDMDPTDAISRLAKEMFREIVCTGEEAEVGVTRDRRVIPVLEELPLDSNRIGLGIQSDWVILSTGGARGIAGQVNLQLARHYHPTLLIVGRSPLPGDEGVRTADIESSDELKRVLIDKYVEETGRKPTPRQVDDELRKLQQDREIRKNLRSLEAAGAKVSYYSVDVRDESAFGAVIEGIYGEYGRLDGVIHAAGVIEDKLVEDKTVDAFDRVFQTKVDGAFTLAQKVQTDALKFFVFFSSIAGRFGNKGQSDYAAANEVLNKLAVYLDGTWPARVLAVNWNPWADVGMAGIEALTQFENNGIVPIKPSTGCHMLDREINLGTKGQPEVVIGQGPWNPHGSTMGECAQCALPLLDGTQLERIDDYGVELVFTLDPVQDPYLRDHRIDGKPVFPFAVAMELMSEVVQRGWPDWVVAGIRSAKRFKGIVLDSQPRQIRVSAKRGKPSEERPEGMDVHVEILDIKQPGSSVYTAVVELARGLPSPLGYPDMSPDSLQPFPMGVKEAYVKWLFHGPCFRGISKVEGFSETGLCALLMPSEPSACLNRRTDGAWLIDPVVIDSAFQLSILWERAHYDMTFLISSVGSYRRFGTFPKGAVRCWAEMVATVGGHLLSTNFHFLDEEGKLIALIENMEGSCSKELNRIVDNATG